MCGIAGVFGPFTEKDLTNKITKMCDEIHHRGPDDWGYTSHPQQSIGMTRLSIIDLAGGHQPIWKGDDVGIVFNGEIYNYVELKQDLIKKGASFQTHSDTEVILELYCLEGVEGLRKLEGMYAMCILDRKEGKAFLIRDPVGIKPFYYGKIDDGFYFGSEIKSIIAACENKPDVNLQAVHDYLTFRYIPGPQTIWENIYKLQPGHMIEYDLNSHKFSVSQYWAPNFHSEPVDPSRDYVKEFEELFLKSVSQQLLASDVPVGAFLSGGLDSSAICAAAVELGHTNFHTYSVAFEDGEKFSELKYARTIADHLKTTHKEVTISVDDFKDFMERQPWHTDEPMADITTVPLYYLAKEAKKDVKAVLSGEGADEFLGGYRYDLFSQVADKRRRQLSAVPNFAFSLMSHLFPKGHSKQILFHNLGNFGWGGYIRSHLYNEMPEFKETGKARLWNGGSYEDSRRMNQRMMDGCKSPHPLDLTMTLGSQDWLVEDLLMKSDKMTMAASLEGRVPFLSRELMDWCLTLPIEWKVGNSKIGYTTKRVLREFSMKRIPLEIINREKKGFPTPVYVWLPNQLRSWSEDILFHQGLLDDWFDMTEVKSVFTQAMAGNKREQYNLVTLITLAQWKKVWV